MTCPFQSFTGFLSISATKKASYIHPSSNSKQIFLLLYISFLEVVYTPFEPSYLSDSWLVGGLVNWSVGWSVGLSYFSIVGLVYMLITSAALFRHLQIGAVSLALISVMQFSFDF